LDYEQLYFAFGVGAIGQVIVLQGTVLQGTVLQGTVIQGIVLQVTVLQGNVIQGTVLQGTVIQAGMSLVQFQPQYVPGVESNFIQNENQSYLLGVKADGT
jgi:hypothetical protein